MGEQFEGGQGGAQHPGRAQLVLAQHTADLRAHHHRREAHHRHQQRGHLGVAHLDEQAGCALLVEHAAGDLDDLVEQAVRRRRAVAQHATEVVDVGAVALDVVQGRADAVGRRSLDQLVLVVEERREHVVVARGAQRALVAEVVHDQRGADARVLRDRSHAGRVEAVARERADRGLADAGSGGEIIGC